jgi:hypothetical protein
MISGPSVASIIACRRLPPAPLAEYLLNQEHGPEKIRDVIVDDVRATQARGDRKHVRTLLHVLHHFLKSHPQALPPQWDRAAPGGNRSIGG